MLKVAVDGVHFSQPTSSAAGVDNYAPDVGINDFNNSQASPYTTAIAAREQIGIKINASADVDDSESKIEPQYISTEDTMTKIDVRRTATRAAGERPFR